MEVVMHSLNPWRTMVAFVDPAKRFDEGGLDWSTDGVSNPGAGLSAWYGKVDDEVHLIIKS